jgi:uncharacterized protein YuzE
MRITYDSSVDALMVRIHEDKVIAKTVEVTYGLVDLDAEDNIVAFELLGASAIIERAAELITRPELQDALTDTLKRVSDEARTKLEHDVQHQAPSRSGHIPT